MPSFKKLQSFKLVLSPFKWRYPRYEVTVCDTSYRIGPVLIIWDN